MHWEGTYRVSRILEQSQGKQLLWVESCYLPKLNSSPQVVLVDLFWLAKGTGSKSSSNLLQVSTYQVHAADKAFLVARRHHDYCNLRPSGLNLRPNGTGK